MAQIFDFLPLAMALLLAALTAFFFVILSGFFFLPFLHRLKYGQSIREEGPASHQKKSGTPHFALGFADDYIKVVKKRNLGLRAYQKLAGQILIAGVTIAIARTVLGHDTSLWIPVVGTFVDIGALYYVLIVFVLVGTSNAVNLTDGLDGLAAGTVTVAALFYAALTYGTDGGLTVFSTAIIGACIGFLWYNHHPARIFMGDTGSLALGGALAAVAILSRTELLLPVVGFVFFCEALSVILQVVSFQTRGKRIFRMSPIHHHFELGGWSETRVVYTFWAVGAAAALLAWGLAAPLL